MCLYPKLIHNKKYTITKKNGGIIPEIKDERTRWVPVGCGKCIECLKQKSSNWRIRLNEELKVNKNAIFVTLTFSDESLIYLENYILDKRTEINKQLSNRLSKKKYSKDYNVHPNLIASRAIRLFLERWRKKYKKSVRHWLITELGQTSTERLHIHGLMFTHVDKLTIEQLWSYGHIWIGDYVNERTINYIIKYVTKIDITHKGYTPQIFCSKGIGANYINSNKLHFHRYNDDETKQYYRTNEGYKLSLPIYYRNKVYNDEEKEKLWISLLDKNVRYVLGLKIDISTNENEYYAKLQHAQRLNKMAGFGDDSKDWKEKDYKNVRKMLKKSKFI